MKSIIHLQMVSLLLCVVMFFGCGPSKKVTRIEPDTTIDLSGEWNDTDSRLTAEEMIKDVLARSWLSDYRAAKEKQPTVIVGAVKNRTTEHIQTTTFIKNLEKELINSGRVHFVASKEERGEVREERADQQEHASDETMKKFQMETGANYLLRGDMTTIIDQEGGEKVKYYQVNLELIDIESNRKVWVGEKKIKKIVSQRGSKF